MGFKISRKAMLRPPVILYNTTKALTFILFARVPILDNIRSFFTKIQRVF